MLNVYEQIDRNKSRSAVIIGLFAVFVSITVYVLGRAFGYGPSFVGFALIFSGLSSFAGYWYSDKIILGISGARPANQEEDRIFRQVGENVSLGAQIPLPKLYVIEDGAPNAFSTGRDINHAVVCVTTGLLEKLDRTELEGVVAHEVSHIRNYDMLLMSVVAVLAGTITLLADWLLRFSWGRRSDEEDRNQAGALLFLLGLILALLSPLIAQLIQLAISRRREFLADAGAAMITRQPGGLISALRKIAKNPEPLKTANKATAHLFIVNPLKEDKNFQGWLANLFNTHPPIEERIKALEAMEG